MSGKYFLTDTFTSEKCKGNPTPVCLLDQTESDAAMHAWAKKLDAPVTVFVEPARSGEVYPVRYFTSTGEIPACGHATLGAAFVLFRETPGQPIIFETVEGIQLTAEQAGDKIFMEYPRFGKADMDIPGTLKEALGIKTYETHFYCEELQSLFIELKQESEVTAITPDYNMLKDSSTIIKEVVIMSKATKPGYDFVLRSFCPWIGIDEDPVTGSIHSVLGPYWQSRLNKDELVACQASDRGGMLYIQPSANSVKIGGYVQLVQSGELTEPATR